MMETDEINSGLSRIKIFKGTFPRDQIPHIKQRPAGFVINTDSAAEPGEHWVSIFLSHKGKGEYFDSFGLPPLHIDLVNYLNTNCPNGWTWNNITLQDPEDSSCGKFCQKFIKARARKIKIV